ncbi:MULTISPECIES: type II secretion system F family protein [unclassified Butyrivibrio]|uniref:type II secretion system F family protein n=1 Tax=unclassified Butyrivibrio TaxID=2639466 RepID=UPI0003B775AE|nr:MULTISPECIES: type II secretion system F family protein [unclassified Butyrivibrio]
MDLKVTAFDIPLIGRNILVLLMIGKLFYGSFIASILIFPLSIPWFVIQKEQKIKKENHDLGIQFKDAMMAVLAAQKAGYSIENSFKEAIHDMRILYGKSAPIFRELQRIEQGIKNSVTIEVMLRELGRRSNNKDIEEFAAVFAVAKRSGGNMTETIERCIDLIGKRMDVENEIDILIAAKRMEAQIMEVVPFGIMTYVGLTNPGFFDALYGNPLGIVIMTVCLVIYIAAYLLTQKIVDIEI